MNAIRIAGLILLLTSAGCASGVYVRSAPPPVSAPAPRVVPPRVVPAAASVTIVLTSQQVAFVRSHFAGRRPGFGRGGPPGGLPPGIARNLARGKPLPPGIAMQYLPGDVVVALPTLDSGLEYVVVGGKLLLVEAATQVVRDVLIETLF